MATITTRAGKGAPLSWTEADANLTNLNNDKIEASALAPYLTSATAASTYETQVNAAATYETQTHATNTFAAKSANLSDLANAATARTNLGLGTAATQASTAFATSGAVTGNGNTMTTARLLGRTTASVGAIEEITVGSGLSLSSGTLSNIGNSLTLSTAVNTTSGTLVDFTSIPSWVKRITVILNGISTNGSSNLTVRIGSGSIQTTGYSTQTTIQVSAGATSALTDSSGFSLQSQLGAADVYQGHMTLTLVSGNVWVCSGYISLQNTTRSQLLASTVTLSGTLDRLRLTTINGTDTFDAGSVNILYE